MIRSFPRSGFQAALFLVVASSLGSLSLAGAQDITYSLQNSGVETTAAVSANSNSTQIDTYAYAVITNYTLWEEGYWVAVEGDLSDNGSWIDSSFQDNGFTSAKASLSDPIHLGDVYGILATSGVCWWEDDGDGFGYEDCDAPWTQAYLYGTLGAPSISSISPNAGTIGKSGTINVNGENLLDPFTGNASPTITGSGVTLSAATSSTETQVNLNFTTAQGATTGDQSLTLQNRFGTSNAATFTVGYPPAVVTNVSPSVWTAGQSTSMTITGTGFGSAPTLSATGTGVNLTLNSASPDGTTIHATATVALNAPNESVTITVQPGYAGSGFYCNCPPDQANGTDTATVQANLPAPTITILNGGTNTPLVGQQVALQVSSPSNYTIASQTWQFINPNDAVANYVITYSGTTASSACYLPVVPGSGTGICNGSVFSLTNSTLGPFYFLVPGATETVTVAARYRMADGSTSDPVSSAPQSFSIQGPTMNLKANMPTNGSGVQVYSYSGKEWFGIWGVSGKPTDPITGIYFQGNATGFPGGTDGLISWVQIISNQQAKSLASSGDVSEPTKAGLDTTFPYDRDDNSADRPADELLASYGEDWRTFTATMYAMWDPGLPSGCLPAYQTLTRNPDGSYTGASIPSECTQSIPVPLSSVTYHWSGCAINTLATQTEPDGSQSTWSKSTSNGCPIQTLGTPGPTNQFPTWTTLGNY